MMNSYMKLIVLKFVVRDITLVRLGMQSIRFAIFNVKFVIMNGAYTVHLTARSENTQTITLINIQ